MGRCWSALLGVAFVALAATTIIDPLALMVDDSWFYLVIGRNLAAGDGATFSHVIPTNGFQPLWQLVVAATMGFARLIDVTAATSQARLVLVSSWVILAVALYALQRLLADLAVPALGQAVGLLLTLGYLGGFTGTAASEANLVLLTLVVALRSVLGILRHPPAVGSAVRCGGLLGLLVLARLDTGFTVAAAMVVIVQLTPGTRRIRLRTAVVAAVSAGVVVAPHLIWNVTKFGHLMPIAGAIKLDRSRIWLEPSSIGIYGWGLLVGGAVLGAAAFSGRRALRSEVVAWAIPYVGGLGSTAVYLAWSPGRITDLAWYHVPHLVACAVAAGLVLSRLELVLPPFLPRIAPTVGAVGVLILVWANVALRIDGANHRFWHPMARMSTEVGRRVPAAGIVLATDNPGVLAAYSGRRIIALDGLTGDYALQDDLRDEGASCALRDRHVGWVLVDDVVRLAPTKDHDNEIGIVSWLHHIGTGSLSLAPSDLVLDDEPTGRSLWRVHPRCAR